MKRRCFLCCSMKISRVTMDVSSHVIGYVFSVRHPKQWTHLSRWSIATKRRETAINSSVLLKMKSAITFVIIVVRHHVTCSFTWKDKKNSAVYQLKQVNFSYGRTGIVLVQYQIITSLWVSIEIDSFLWIKCLLSFLFVMTIKQISGIKLSRRPVSSLIFIELLVLLITIFHKSELSNRTKCKQIANNLLFCVIFVRLWFGTEIWSSCFGNKFFCSHGDYEWLPFFFPSFLEPFLGSWRWVQ